MKLVITSLQEIQGLFEGEVQLHTDIVEVPSRAGLGNTLFHFIHANTKGLSVVTLAILT